MHAYAYAPSASPKWPFGTFILAASRLYRILGNDLVKAPRRSPRLYMSHHLEGL